MQGLCGFPSRNYSGSSHHLNDTELILGCESLLNNASHRIVLQLSRSSSKMKLPLCRALKLGEHKRLQGYTLTLLRITLQSCLPRCPAKSAILAVPLRSSGAAAVHVTRHATRPATNKMLGHLMSR